MQKAKLAFRLQSGAKKQNSCHASRMDRRSLFLSVDAQLHSIASLDRMVPSNSNQLESHLCRFRILLAMNIVNCDIGIATHASLNHLICCSPNMSSRLSALRFRTICKLKKLVSLVAERLLKTMMRCKLLQLYAEIVLANELAKMLTSSTILDMFAMILHASAVCHRLLDLVV